MDQGSNPCLLHWQADSLLLSYQGSTLPLTFFFFFLAAQALPYGVQAFLVVAFRFSYPWHSGLVAQQHVRSLFLDQGLSPRPLLWKVES